MSVCVERAKWRTYNSLHKPQRNGSAFVFGRRSSSPRWIRERERERKDGRHSRTPVQKAEPDRERCGKLIWPLAEIERETERQSQTERKERTEERAKGHPTIGFKLQMKHFSLSLCFCQQKPTKLQTFLLFLLLLLSLSVPVLRRSVPVSRSRSRSEH